MKKRMLITLSIILFTILFILCMSDNIFAAELSKIEITVPVPTIGKTLAKASEITVRADGSEEFEVFEVSWSKGHVYDSEKEVPSNTKVEADEEYAVIVHYKRPNRYGVTSSTEVTVNGAKRNTGNIEEFNNYGGDGNYTYDCVCYNFGFSRVQKNLSKIEITVPIPTVGNTLAKASEITVKADGNEKFEVFDVLWSKGHTYDYKTEVPSNTKVEMGEEYSVMVHYKRPDKYGVTTSTEIKINGTKRNIGNIEEFNNYGGEKDYRYDSVCLNGIEVAKNTSESDDKQSNTAQQPTNQSTTKPSATKPSTTKHTTNKTSTTEKVNNKVIENSDPEPVKDETIETVNTEKINDELSNEVVKEVVNTDVTTTIGKNSKTYTPYIMIAIVFVVIIGIAGIFLIRKKNAKE